MRISDWSSYVCSSDLILLAPLLQLLTSMGQIIGGPAHGMLGMDRRIASVNLWAPAITMDMFLMSYVPAIEARMVDRACLFTLTDKAEQDDSCAGIYNKSLLYLVAHAFEQQARSWIDRRLRSEEHTSELQSLMRISYAVFCLKKKKNNKTNATEYSRILD